VTNFQQAALGLGIAAGTLYCVYLGLLATHIIGYVHAWVHGGVDEGPLKGVKVPGREKP
jgi:hypothetical protein